MSRNLRERTAGRLAAVAVLAALLLGLAAAQDDDAADAEQPAADATVRTASYGVFPVEGSGVSGHLQVTSTTEGGVRLVLSVSGLAESRELGAAIYEGDCGPDRPLLLRLTPVGMPNDPFVSITESDIAFDTLTEGDHFVYLFEENEIDTPEQEGLDVPALACGEVGAGANR